MQPNGIAPGAEIAYTVTYLEMTRRPDRPRPPQILGRAMTLLRAEQPPVHFFRYLYDMVGRDYHWTDMHAWRDEDIASFIQHEAVSLYVLHVTGWPGGFVMLDSRKSPVCNISYYGLAPEAIGQGYGNFLLGTAVHMAWDSGIEKLTVNTCSLDHPRALPTYQKWGFEPVRREQHVRKVKPHTIP